MTLRTSSRTGARSVPFLVAAGLSVALGFASARAQFPETPAGARLETAIRTINSGDMSATTAFIADHHTERSLEFFGEDWLFDLYYGLFERYGRLELDHVTKSTPEKAVAVFRCARTGTAYRFGVTIEAGAPHRIRGVTILPRLDAGEETATELRDDEIGPRLGSILDRLARDDVFSGVVLVARGEEILLHEAYGWASREPDVPVEVGTKLNLASISKTFTAVAIAQLVEQGKLAWEDPIGKFLGPEWVSPDVGRKVRVEHLLSHTSGVGGEETNLEYVRVGVAGGFREVDEYRPYIATIEPGFEPGTRSEYSNVGFHLLGAIVERASGQDYYDRITAQIFEPAEMVGAGYPELDRPLDGLTIGYEKTLDNGAVAWRDNEYDLPPRGTPAGLAYATAEDLFRFVLALRRDELVTAETRRILFAPKEDLGSSSYGFGFQVRALDGKTTVSHTGGWTGINDVMTMGLDDDSTVIILSNVDILTGTVCDDLRILIREMLDRSRA